MTLQTSGKISFSDIRDEFESTNPVKMTQFYGKDTGIPDSGKIKASDFYGQSNAWGIISRVLVTSAENQGIDRNIAMTRKKQTDSQLWIVVCYAYGERSRASAPSNPTIDGVSITRRAWNTTYYSDDGAGAGIWAMPVNPSDSARFRFTPDYSGYGNSRTAVYIVEGPPANANVESNTKSGNVATFIEVNTPAKYHACFCAGSSHKSGVGSVTGEETRFTYGGCSADQFHPGAGTIATQTKKRFNLRAQCQVAISIDFGDVIPINPYA